MKVLYFSQTEQRWIAEITLSDGRKRKKRDKDKQIVQDWLLEQRHNKSLNLPLRDEKITVGNYLDRFMADVAEHTLKPSTIQSYRFIVNDHINRPWVT